MARFYGEIGFGDTVETAPGVWEDGIIERKFSGTVLRNIRQTIDGDTAIDDITLNNSISIMANRYALHNLQKIRYIKFEGEYWEINSVDVQYPRLVLNMGGVYNGPTATASGAA